MMSAELRDKLEDKLKKLKEMRTYFQDLFESCQLAGGFEKSIFDCTERASFEMFCETLGFIYGDAFKDIRPTWTQEALDISIPG